jgi:hypothetical protein
MKIFLAVDQNQGCHCHAENSWAILTSKYNEMQNCSLLFRVSTFRHATLLILFKEECATVEVFFGFFNQSLSFTTSIVDCWYPSHVEGFFQHYRVLSAFQPCWMLYQVVPGR